MTGAKGSRVVIKDKFGETIRIKSAKEIADENEEFSKLLGLQKEKKMSTDQKSEKTESQNSKYEELMKKKAVEKAVKEEAIMVVEAAEELDTTKEEIDLREGVAPVPVQEVKPAPKQTVATASKKISLNFGVVGAGQAGGRLAEIFYKLGYEVCAINTARQDLEYLEVPEEHKFFLNYSLGGAGKDLEVGRAAIEEDYKAVSAFVEERTADAEVIVLALSGGGGTGSGVAETLVEMVSAFGKPVVMIYVLPGSYDDSLSKYNAVQTLSKLADLTSSERINSLILVDNAKIEVAYPNLAQSAFWKTANEAIIKPLHAFNTVTASPTEYEALDSMDFAKSLVEAGNCVVFGSNTVPAELYEEDETALVEAIIDDLDRGLLAGGFKLEEAQTVGVLVIARQEVLDRIPYHNISFVFKYIQDTYDSARTYKGVYAMPSDNDDITIHFIFSGLVLPADRIKSLQTEAKKRMDQLDSKKKGLKMSVDLGKDKTTSAADDIMSRIRKKRSPVGKLINNSRRGPVRRRR